MVGGEDYVAPRAGGRASSSAAARAVVRGAFLNGRDRVRRGGGGLPRAAILEWRVFFLPGVRVAPRAVSELKDLHRRRMRTMDETEATDLESQIEIVTGDVTTRFGNAGKQLKAIAGAAKDARGGVQRTVEETVRVNLQRSLAAKLHALSTEFRKSQNSYLAEMKRMKASTSLDIFTRPGGAAGAAGGGTTIPDETDEGFSAAQAAAVDDMVDLAHERDQEILAIVRSINDLAEMFKELQTLVVDQGTLLDRIDYNLDLTLDRVNEGVKHVQKAEEYQKSARPLWCIGALMLLIIIFIIVIIVRKAK